MIFNDHSNLVGQHAFLSPSTYHWINYTEEKLDIRFTKAMAAKRGTDLHALASESIRLGVKLQGRSTIAMYVNDAIGYRMTPEQPLFYSNNCFGTADTISFRRKTLRIHDLKTGDSPTSEIQLKVYAALFCLEYKIDIFEIETELRIYQSDECRTYPGNAEEIRKIMGTIILFDKRIEALKMEV